MRRIPLQAGVLFCLVCSLTPADDWTRFRGPNGSGVSSDTGFPVEFGKDRNLLWRTPVRPGKSSPVLTPGRIFLTASENQKLFTQCFDRLTGKLLWEQAEDRPRQEDVNKLNHPAALTPVTDGTNVYVFFKDLGVLSYDSSGRLRWKVPLGPFSNSMGLGASPILAGESVVVVADQYEHSYIAAFDRRNGEIRWRTPRAESEGWATPLFLDTPGDGPQILTASRGQVGAHRLSDGTRTFSHIGFSPAIVASPVLDHDTVFVFGYGADSVTPFSRNLEKYDKNHDGVLTPGEYGDNAVLVAIGRYVGNGDGIVTKQEWDEWIGKVAGPSRLMALRLEQEQNHSIHPRELWRYEKSFVGVVPSPLLYQGVLYVVKNGGILTAFDPQTGAVLKAGRVEGAIGGYSASPVAAEGKIFLASEDGELAVLRAGREWEVLRINDLGEGCYATPALSEGRIYLRTNQALYCFGTPRH